MTTEGQTKRTHLILVMVFMVKTRNTLIGQGFKCKNEQSRGRCDEKRKKKFKKNLHCSQYSVHLKQFPSFFPNDDHPDRVSSVTSRQQELEAKLQALGRTQSIKLKRPPELKCLLNPLLIAYLLNLQKITQGASLNTFLGKLQPRCCSNRSNFESRRVLASFWSVFQFCFNFSPFLQLFPWSISCGSSLNEDEQNSKRALFTSPNSFNVDGINNQGLRFFLSLKARSCSADEI